MVKKESRKVGKWYFFDPVTGSMALVCKRVSSFSGNWVCYDPSNGQMLRIEACIHGNRQHFYDWSSIITYEWKYSSSSGVNGCTAILLWRWVGKGWSGQRLSLSFRRDKPEKCSTDSMRIAGLIFVIWFGEINESAQFGTRHDPVLSLVRLWA